MFTIEIQYHKFQGLNRLSQNKQDINFRRTCMHLFNKKIFLSHLNNTDLLWHHPRYTWLYTQLHEDLWRSSSCYRSWWCLGSFDASLASPTLEYLSKRNTYFWPNILRLIHSFIETPNSKFIVVAFFIKIYHKKWVDGIKMKAHNTWSRLSLKSRV